MKRRASKTFLYGAMLLIFAEVLCAQRNPAALASGGAIQLRAVLPPVLKVQDESFPVTFNLPGGENGQNSTSFPLSVEWNVELSTREVWVIAYFSDAAHALTDVEGHTVASASIEGRLENGIWRNFSLPRHDAHTAGNVVLFVQRIQPTDRVGKRAGHFELRYNPAPTSHGAPIAASFMFMRSLYETLTTNSAT